MSTLILSCILALIVGFISGYFLGKRKAGLPADLSGVGAQIAEMKVKFEEIEKSRVALEKAREEIAEEKEKRLKDWMDSTNRIFNELKDKSEKTDSEKDKRISEWMDATKKFFAEQKSATEKFLEAQGKGRLEIEGQRDAQLSDMKNMIQNFTRTVAGTKTRGMVGEEILRDVLHNSIQAGVVETNLKTDNGEVEFAWKLDANKYIPIDAKLPDVFELVEKYNSAVEPEQQKAHKKDIIEKIKKEIKNVQKYQNLTNTIDNCMLVAPPAVLEIAPEVVSLGKESSVFVCTYKDVFPIAHVLEEQYLRMKEEGDIGKYKQLVKSLFQILERINAKTDTIKTAVTQIVNANDAIREEVSTARKQRE